MQCESSERGGWGRMELAVAAFIVLLLIALGIPALLANRESARRQFCADRMHAIARGVGVYSSQVDAFPYGSVVNSKLPAEQRLSWYVAAWPYPAIGAYPETELVLDHRAKWDAPGNFEPQIRRGQEMRPFLAPEVLRCPAAGLVNVSKTGPGFTEYVGTAGVGRQAWALSKDSPGRGVWNVDLQTGLDDITRGQSHVLLLIETARDNGPWTASATPTLRGFDPAGAPPIGGLGQFGGWHAGGANVVYVDGHMQFIGGKIDPHIFSSLCLIARPD